MTVYLNSIEMGKGIYGAQAAARYKFHTTAAKLTAGQCALIAATLAQPSTLRLCKPLKLYPEKAGTDTAANETCTEISTGKTLRI